MHFLAVVPVAKAHALRSKQKQQECALKVHMCRLHIWLWVSILDRFCSVWSQEYSGMCCQSEYKQQQQQQQQQQEVSFKKSTCYTSYVYI